MPECPSCGATNGPSDAFCTTCGTTLPSPTQPLATGWPTPPGGPSAQPPEQPGWAAPPTGPFGDVPAGAPSSSGSPFSGGPEDQGGSVVSSSRPWLAIWLGVIAGLVVVGGLVALLLVGRSSDGDDEVATETTEAPATTEADEPPATTATTADDDEPPAPDDDLPPADEPGDLGEPGFDALGQACFEGNLAMCDTLYRVTPIDSAGEAYGETCGGRNAPIPNGCGAEYDWSLPEAQQPGDLGSSEFDALGEDCFDGDLAACDRLYAITPIDSTAEAYGWTCGGRSPVAALDDLSRGACSTDYGSAD